MGSDILTNNLAMLTEYWKNQNIDIVQNFDYEIDAFQKDAKVELPDDFRIYYLTMNGMSSHFPNWMDKNGFLFYPLEEVEPFNKIFKKRWGNRDKKNILIFAEYMHKSWWYGIRIDNVKNAYEIGIISDEDQFKPISNSLSDFIQFYLQDASILYV
ncbi:SMI1/KNR4 family protein [Chitinophaga rhizophila]|uniref:SMI1/KNR4 family protein n=1 Tax=Chitinophaga rhizophila TaxID=2866212 RepID=A0ABS7GAM5_9BACT|nr:SMI1/KNR4 family protein [Chitinophaga rhizophila]MBW8684708.1 SMI1/KNR4 family protein [Chitinophaga rhizophila]